MTTDLCWGCSRSFTNLRVRAPNTNSQSFLCFSLQTHASTSFLEARGRCNCASKGSVQRQMWTLSDPTSCSDLPTPAAPFLPPVDAPTCHNMQHVLACRCVPILHATDVLIPPATTSHSYPQFTCSADYLWKAIVHDRRKAGNPVVTFIHTPRWKLTIAPRVYVSTSSLEADNIIWGQITYIHG